MEKEIMNYLNSRNVKFTKLRLIGKRKYLNGKWEQFRFEYDDKNNSYGGRGLIDYHMCLLDEKHSWIG